MATSKQAKKLLEVFEDVETDPMQAILGSGALTVVRDRPDLHSLILGVSLGTHEIRAVEHAFDRSLTPKLPFNGAEVVEHRGTGVSKLERRKGSLYIDGKKIHFYMSRVQKTDSILGTMLRNEVTKHPVLDANVLDHLLERADVIPEDWKLDEEGRTRFIFFWGTIYCGANGELLVRYLCCLGGRWQSHYYSLDCRIGVSSPAVVSASS